MAFDPREILDRTPGPQERPSAPLAGTRKERLQRLQVGAFGLGSMVLIVGLANIILTSAQHNQQSQVVAEPEAIATEDVPPPARRDPLADAGVVPELAPDPQAAAAPTSRGSDVPAPAQD